VRSSAALLSFLPFLLIGAIRVINPAFVEPLFKTPGGNVVILLCVVMDLIGNSVMKKMIVKTIGE
ncbi:MAG: hypothetical protein K6U74_16755, partial [Firmicutes bacterium]|nr:hypothetical protein [Bacillota bacterium]